jgi:hypothetical protein
LPKIKKGKGKGRWWSEKDEYKGNKDKLGRNDVSFERIVMVGCHTG